MFGAVITTAAHLAVAGARVHSNNTAEMIAMVAALSSGAVMRTRVSSVSAWARFRPARMYSLPLLANSLC